MAQMFDHTLDAVKGWFHMAALDFTAKISADETDSAYVFAGRVVHLDNNGDFKLGCTGSQMPIFLLQNGNDADVSNAGGGVWYPINPEGNITGLVAKGAYELETTEFDTARTYYPNDYLRCTGSSGATNGKLTNNGVSTLVNGGSNPTAIVGVVSRAPRKRQTDRNTVLAFWPVYHPGKTSY
jgi:hypothetical protein